MKSHLSSAAKLTNHVILNAVKNLLLASDVSVSLHVQVEAANPLARKKQILRIRSG